MAKKRKTEKKGFGQKEKLAHYTAVANGDKPTKAESKFSQKEQQAYARGQRDARNEANRIYAYKNSSELERQAYAERKKEERALRKVFSGLLD